MKLLRFAFSAVLLAGLALLFGLTNESSAQEPVLVKQWTFDVPGDKENWTGANCLKDVTVSDGVLRGTITGRDSFVSTSGDWELPARPWNAFKARIRFLYDGELPIKSGELFYANDNSGPYGGYSQAKTARWVCGDANQWVDVDIYPFWGKQGKIIKLRFDFPAFPNEMFNQVQFEIDWIKIVDLQLEKLQNVKPGWTMDQDRTLSWSSPFFSADCSAGSWFSIEAQGNGQVLDISWMNGQGDFQTMTTTLEKDAQLRVYNFNLATRKAFNGEVHQFKLRVRKNLDAVSEDGADPIALKSVSLNAEPQGSACVDAMFTGIEDAIVRAGYDSAFFLDLVNAGGRDTGALQIANLKLPKGIQAGDWSVIEPIKKAERRRILFPITANEPVEGSIEFDICSADGTDAANQIRPVSFSIPITVLPSLNLPKASYVPEPKPVKSEYEIGALYFPGWYQGHSWERIWTRCPDRLPMLGWYNESSPEVIDWQIKWSVENGIQFYLVDWYWSKGSRSLEHWVKGFQQAKYRKYLKWAMMWANHNGPGSHSLEDQTNVTQYWLDNYFNTPEYYCIDGKPVVMIWSPEGMDRDMIAREKANGRELKRGEGVKMLLDLSQKMAKDAGYKGICFISMKWPEASTRPEDIQWLKDAGFEMTSLYHFMDDGGKAKTRKRFSFDLVVDAIKPYWEKRNEAGVLPFLPNLATGWDDRPWNDHCWICDRTPEKFGAICRLFKEFSKESGIKRAILAPVNEWGEGSYAEPCREFGFGMYEAIRENLCEKPAEGWPLNYGPKDVGLGPYEYTEGAKY